LVEVIEIGLPLPPLHLLCTRTFNWIGWAYENIS